MSRHTRLLAALAPAMLAVALASSGCRQSIDGRPDAGSLPESDAGQPVEDAGTADASLPDASHPDAGALADAGSPDACVPLTCDQAPGACGQLSDGCGGALVCACSYAHVCGATEPNTCGCANESWVLKHVDREQDVGRHTSMARYANGDLHLAYIDLNVGVKYAHVPRGSSFAVTVGSIDPEAHASDTSIAVDEAGTLHVTYYRWLLFGTSTWDVELWYAQKPAGGEWTRELVVSAGYFCYVAGGGAVMRLDAAGGVHVFFTHWYYDGADFNFASRLAPGTWDLQTVFSGHRFAATTLASAGHPAFAIGADGTMHAAFEYYIGGDLYYATKPLGGAWQVHDQRIASPEGLQAIGLQSAMEVDARGGVHVALWSWLTADTTDLRYAFRAAGADAWTLEQIDPPPGTAGDVGEYVSLALDPAGGVHVAYQEQASLALRYAFRESSGAWTVETIDATGKVGYDTSILAERDAVHVAYYEFVPPENGRLKLAYRCRAATSD